MIIEVQRIAAHFSRYKAFRGNPYLEALIDLGRSKRVGGHTRARPASLAAFDKECAQVFSDFGPMPVIEGIELDEVSPEDLMESYQMQQDERRAQNTASNRNMVRQAKQRLAQGGGVPLGEVPALTPQEAAAAAASPTAAHASQHRISIGDMLAKANTGAKKALSKLHSRKDRADEAQNLPPVDGADAWPEGAGAAPGVDPASVDFETQVFTDPAVPVDAEYPPAASNGGSPDRGTDETSGPESDNETPLELPG